MFTKVAIDYNGQSFEVDTTDLDILDPGNPTDEALRSAISLYLRDSLSLGASPNLASFRIGPPESERFAGQHTDKTILNFYPSAQWGV